MYHQTANKHPDTADLSASMRPNADQMPTSVKRWGPMRAGRHASVDQASFGPYQDENGPAADATGALTVTELHAGVVANFTSITGDLHLLNDEIYARTEAQTRAMAALSSRADALEETNNSLVKDNHQLRNDLKLMQAAIARLELAPAPSLSLRSQQLSEPVRGVPPRRLSPPPLLGARPRSRSPYHEAEKRPRIEAHHREDRDSHPNSRGSTSRNSGAHSYAPASNSRGSQRAPQPNRRYVELCSSMFIFANENFGLSSSIRTHLASWSKYG
ncbi:hypothetical protein DFH06DRAFT_1139367 [Mycena polygramma]|nr:hypothetical protein DFH06DRAFT_1139367 [Mycena polygramma]